MKKTIALLLTAAALVCGYAIGANSNKLIVDGTDMGEWESFTYHPDTRRIEIVTVEGNRIFLDRFEVEP